VNIPNGWTKDMPWIGQYMLDESGNAWREAFSEFRAFNSWDWLEVGLAIFVVIIVVFGALVDMRQTAKSRRTRI